VPVNPFSVLVDYAHTDDALANVLSALRPLTKSRLRVLFGCGGDRDRTKRPRMAKVAEKYADAIYVTSDNPRTEDPKLIVDEIVTGFSRPQRKMIRVEARSPGGDRADPVRCRERRCGAAGGQGPREVPDPRRREAPL
jgi:UDP-N-acetylmuramoyl-L-alanyl-D-glutamate--2,6-diaminopimelate ligase